MDVQGKTREHSYSMRRPRRCGVLWAVGFGVVPYSRDNVTCTDLPSVPLLGPESRPAPRLKDPPSPKARPPHWCGSCTDGHGIPPRQK
jgi:hypothetical protein